MSGRKRKTVSSKPTLVKMAEAVGSTLGTLAARADTAKDVLAGRTKVRRANKKKPQKRRRTTTRKS